MTNPDSQTVELDREFLDTLTVQGREYQKYSIDHRIYFGPVDEEEAQRLDHQQRIFQRIFDDRLIFPPIRRLKRVLDCGHGSASWAVEVAEQYPDCEWVHLLPSHFNWQDPTPQNKPAQVSTFTHLNLDSLASLRQTRVDDLNRTFTFPPNHFDLVQSRLLATGIHKARWPTYIRDIVRVLKPGGWVQMIEIYFNVQSDNGSITDDHALRRWSTQYMRALEDRKDLRIGSRLRGLLTSEGLTEVDTKMIPLPLSAWSHDRRTREIGQANSQNIQELLRSLALYPLTQRLHMSPQTFDALVDQAQAEARNPSLKAYFPLYVCIGRKA
ncbi:hypothetical protein N7532_000617 [Penicillium argentinense]|uniref:S-adenosyl-L-methionine-dependent methyltransferase n=1 Tax=Penicillium argentinense TaxID=1131581 RepID=A0A9W9G5V7_9EURO|nr:uncharacterized protein N7532_000617 [Penicillium argentinense]KAJ5112572.1 hypothetical protein N7532_000617 [Penicillium argentinense]